MAQFIIIRPVLFSSDPDHYSWCPLVVLTDLPTCCSLLSTLNARAEGKKPKTTTRRSAKNKNKVFSRHYHKSFGEFFRRFNAPTHTNQHQSSHLLTRYFVLLCISQVRSRTHANGPSVNGGSPDRMSWRVIIESTREPNRSSAWSARGALRAAITWRCTWNGTYQKVNKKGGKGVVVR